MKNLEKSIPKFMAGSALAGFGFSFGRDLYKSTKKSIGMIIALFIIFGVLYSVRLSMIWLFRNYKNFFASIVIKILSLVLYIFSFTAAILILAVFTLPIAAEIDIPAANVHHTFWLLGASMVNFASVICTPIFYLLDASSPSAIFLPVSLEEFKRDFSVDELISIVASGTVLVILSASGIYSGIRHRGKRSLAWNIEDSNRTFLRNTGLKEVADEQFKDDNDNLYRVEKIHFDRIEMFPIGKRGKRAYLHFDQSGRFTKWSGIVRLQ